MIKLANLRKNDKFKWNGNTYTVWAQEYLMVEVFGNGRFWAWPTWAVVEKVNYN
jgi:hypothetical protein